MRKLSTVWKLVIALVVCLAIASAAVGGYIAIAKKFGIGAFNQHDKTVFATDREYLEFRQPFEADYIWINENGVAVWAAFSKDVWLDDDEDFATFDISCDTHYWLWVNGEEIVWEGALKRGVTPTDSYYDRVSVEGKFKAGKNNVSVLVRHLGDDGYSHKDSGQGGLVIEGKIGEHDFRTDGSWKAKKYAYDYDKSDFIFNMNFRLSERGSKIIGERYTEFWKGEDTSTWDDAVVLTAEQKSAFGRSYLNPLPQKQVDEVEYFDVSACGEKATRLTTYEFSLDVNSMFCPYFEFESDNNESRIIYYTENKALDYRNTYTAKVGENKFLDFAWINGEKLIVKIEKGITLKKVGVRKTHYGATRNENGFTCSDDELNALWQKGLNTLWVTMRDSYMDCPDRERAQWIADAVVESDMSFYALSPEASALFRKAIVTTYGWVHADGVIQTVVPDGVEAYELPLQNLAFLVGCVNYMFYSGDYSVKPMVLSMAKGYLPLWSVKNELVEHREGSWDWGDWGTNVDMLPLENAWYYYAASKIAQIASDDADLKSFCEQRMDEIRVGYAQYYKSFGIASGKKADDRANAIAVLAGLYRQEDKDILANTLYSVRNSSPYMEKYVEEALCELGRVDLALKRAKEVYHDMIYDECTTLWESWSKSVGTTNHAWAGGTLLILSKYVGGVRPTSDGFATFEIKPELSVMRDFSVTLNPVENVNIAVNARSNGNMQTMIVQCSSEGGVLVVTGKNFVFNGESVKSDSVATHRFELQKGSNTITFET